MSRLQAHPALCPPDSKGCQAALQALSLPELSGALEDRVHEMGESLAFATTQRPDVG